MSGSSCRTRRQTAGGCWPRGDDPARGHLLEIFSFFFFTTGTTHRGVLRQRIIPNLSIHLSTVFVSSFADIFVFFLLRCNLENNCE